MLRVLIRIWVINTLMMQNGIEVVSRNLFQGETLGLSQKEVR